MTLNIEILNNKIHSRESFTCEHQSLTNYIKTQASQDVGRNLTMCYVLLDGGNVVKGYYTLSSNSVDRGEIPDVYQKKVPRHYDVPVILLGRLARDISMKGKGCGELLLLDALYKCRRSSESIGAMAIVVDPIDVNAVNFYSKYGFTLLDSRKMFLPMNVVPKLFGDV